MRSGDGSVGSLFALAMLSGMMAWAASSGTVMKAGSAREPVSPSQVRQKLDPVHEAMIRRLASRRAQGEATSPLAVCFAPGTPNEVIEAVQQALGFNDRFQPTSRWDETATDGATGPQGSPITLTYSFVPDTTTIPGSIGEPTAGSNLFATFDAIYGNTATWQNLFHDTLARWGELSGVTYVFEPNDDGALFPDSAGVVGTRGDVRISGHFIDGPGGTLAYNFFPLPANTVGGDMVLDTGDTFYDALHANSIRLRNVVSHEAGHGLGFRHVCPPEQTKLMEPSATARFDGPQHDDIRAIQFHYGDQFEPNDSAGTAAPLGVLNPGDVVLPSSISGIVPSFGANLSLAVADSSDHFEITVNSSVRLDVIVSPVGFNYDDSPQSCSANPASCCNGSFTNSRLGWNPRLEVTDAATSSVIASADASGAGVAESLSEVLLPGAGNYIIQVSSSAPILDQALYRLRIDVDDAFLEPEITFPSGAPTVIPPSTPFNVAVNINPKDDTIDPASPVLRYRLSGGTFLSAPLTLVNAATGDYTATIPAAACGDLAEFFIEASATVSGLVSEPAAGAAGPLVAQIGTIVDVVSLDFETDPGWVVAGNAVDGQWEIGVPVNNGRGDPDADFDGVGAGNCFLTDNDTLTVNSDVDGGTTFLTSTIMDISSVSNPQLSYARWYDNSIGSSGQEDRLTIQISGDGGTSFQTLEVIGPSLGDANPEVQGGWFVRTFDLGALTGSTSQFQIRFIAQDLGLGSVVEVGLDAFRISGLQCTAPICCIGNAQKFAGNVIDFDDIVQVLAAWDPTGAITNPGGNDPGDADCDGDVDFDDVLAVLSNSGLVCP